MASRASLSEDEDLSFVAKRASERPFWEIWKRNKFRNIAKQFDSREG
jgi:hypothetical protein